MLVGLKFVNGVATSFGWPSLAKIFVNWYTDPTQRGSMYSILSTNQNIGSALIPMVLIPAMEWVLHFGRLVKAMDFLCLPHALPHSRLSHDLRHPSCCTGPLPT
jgi:sugar phosphate permease